MSDDTTGATRPYDGWSDAQWRDWFIREVEPTELWQRIAEEHDVSEGYWEYDDLAGLDLDFAAAIKAIAPDWWDTDESRRTLASAGMLADSEPFALAFWSLSHHKKVKFFEEWTAHHARQDDLKNRTEQPPAEPATDSMPEAQDDVATGAGSFDPAALPNDADLETDAADWGDDSYDVNITLPGGNVISVVDDTSNVGGAGGTAESTGRLLYSSDTDDILKRPFVSDSDETPEARAQRLAAFFRKRKIPLAFGLAIGAIGAIAVVSMTGGGGNDSADPNAVALPSAPVVTEAEPGGAITNTTLLTPIAATTAAPADACAVAAQQDYDMQFTSVDVIDGIGEEFSQRAGDATGYQTPSFTWSGIPPAATELVIVMQWVPENRRDEIITATNLWEETEPPGSSRWVLRGIDPTSTGIRRTSLDTGLPAGTQEIDHTGGVVQIGGQPALNKFLGPDAPERTYMFTLLALCDPQLGTPFDESLGWFRRFAIDTTWFFADASF